MKFLALDFETSGLDSKRHAPVSLGVAVFEEGNLLDSKEWTIAPPTDKNGKISREYDICALQISGYTWAQIKNGTPLMQVMRELEAFAKANGVTEAMVLAYNAPFDFAWYSECLFLSGSWNPVERKFEGFRPPLVGAWQCARLIASRRLSLQDYKLDTVAGHCGLARTTDKHGALEDAILAGRLFNLLTNPVTA